MVTAGATATLHAQTASRRPQPNGSATHHSSGRWECALPTLLARAKRCPLCRQCIRGPLGFKANGQPRGRFGNHHPGTCVGWPGTRRGFRCRHGERQQPLNSFKRYCGRCLRHCLSRVRPSPEWMQRDRRSRQPFPVSPDYPRCCLRALSLTKLIAISRLLGMTLGSSGNALPS